MDNIIIKKMWQDIDFLEIRIDVKTSFLSVYQDCYLSENEMRTNAMNILEYVSSPEKERYIEFGKKNGNYTPAFSIRLLPIDVFGHVKMEMDMEINDNDFRLHRCTFYLNTEIGLVEQFALKLESLVNENVGGVIELLSE